MFIKWIEIENAYRHKIIQKYFDEFPELYKETFIKLPKLDGANFSVIIDSDRNVNFASRNQTLGEMTSFYNYDVLFKKEEYQNFINEQKEDCAYHGVTRQIVGELCGNSINGRIKYGDLFWRFFGVYEKKDGSDIVENLTPSEIYESDIFSITLRLEDREHLNMEDYNSFTEMIASINLRQADAYSVNWKDEPKFGDNLLEGVVIRPYGNNYFNHNGLFIVKHKNPEFDGKQGKLKKDSVLTEDITLNLIEYGRDYINTNRTKDLFSKYGEMESMHKFKEYMDNYFRDFIGDFRKDYPEFDDLSIAQKKIFNREIYNLIRDELKENV